MSVASIKQRTTNNKRGLDGRKGGQLLSFSAAGRRHDCYFTMLVCHACRVTLVSRACFAGVHALAPCAPVQSRHATSSLVACYPPFPVCQSLARKSLAVYSRCSPARWISYLSLCCMLFCTPPMGQGLSPSNWLHPSGAFSAWLREGHWPPENKPLPGGAGGVALWPLCRPRVLQAIPLRQSQVAGVLSPRRSCLWHCIGFSLSTRP